MRLYSLQRVQCLPITLHEAWRFFSNPQNLSQITPPYLRFELTSDVPDRMYPGMILTYRIRPLLGIPLTWVTEITHVVEPYRFVDEQRGGPYRFWHHQHFFREISGGTEIQDLVHYALPWGPVARRAHGFLVGEKLQGIFDYRHQMLEQMFGTMACHTAAEPSHPALSAKINP